MTVRSAIVVGLLVVITGAIAGVLVLKDLESRPGAARVTVTQAPASAPIERPAPPPRVAPQPLKTPATAPERVAIAPAEPPALRPTAPPAPRAERTPPRTEPRVSEPTISEPEARQALSYVGADPVANEVWGQAINDPNLSANVRKNLIEDLNEDGFADPRNVTADDLPLIVSRLQLIEELAPDAMDDANAAAFAEAYKDLVNMYNRLTQ